MINGKYIIGILGGVGSGKSTVLNYITSHYQAEAIYADEVGRELMRPGKSVYYALLEVYGDALLSADGTIDKEKLSAIVYESETSQKEVNGIEHPLIKSEIESRILNARARVIFLEAALLIEGGLKEICDEIWMITADREIRIRRLMENRQYSRKRCEAIMALQMDEQTMKKHAQIRIDNGNDFSETQDAVDYYMNVLSLDLHEDLKKY